MRLARAFQAVILLVPVCTLGWLAWQEVVPTGVFVVRHAVNETSPFLDRLLPDQRVQPPYRDADGDWVQPIVDDPAFFFAHPHRHFDTVEADVWFKNTDVPIVELGALANADADAYDLQPLQNLIIDRSSWPRVAQDSLVLLQRTNRYASVDAFLADLPPRDQIATYHYRLMQPYVLPGYVASGTEQTIDVSLRGFHEWKTYLKNETLSFDVAFMDMNRDDGADPITALVTAEDGTLVGQAYAEDDGDISDKTDASALRHVTIRASGLPEGVYKIEWRASRDIFIRSIKTPQHKIVFLNNLYLGDEVGWRASPRAATFWTEGKHLAFTTQHAQGVQTVSVGKQSVAVSEPYARTPAEVDTDGVVGVVIPKADMIVQTDGHIAFSADQYFNPDPVRLLQNTDLDRLGVNYIIAQYTPPQTVDGWTIAHATFDTDKMAMIEDAWKFVFSTPGIADLHAQLLVGRIDMTWRRPPFSWQDVVEWWHRYVRI